MRISKNFELSNMLSESLINTGIIKYIFLECTLFFCYKKYILCKSISNSLQAVRSVCNLHSIHKML